MTAKLTINASKGQTTIVTAQAFISYHPELSQETGTVPRRMVDQPPLLTTAGN